MKLVKLKKKIKNKNYSSSKKLTTIMNYQILSNNLIKMAEFPSYSPPNSTIIFNNKWYFIN